MTVAEGSIEINMSNEGAVVQIKVFSSFLLKTSLLTQIYFSLQLSLDIKT